MESSLRRVRRTNRRLGGLLLGVLACFLVTLLAGLAPAQRSVDAAAFVVRDQAGRARARLGLDDGTPALSLYDEEGTLRGAFALDAAGPIINLFSPTGEPRVVLAERDRRAFLVLRDATGAPRAAMAVQESGEPSLYLLDAQLTPLWRQPPAQR